MREFVEREEWMGDPTAMVLGYPLYGAMMLGAMMLDFIRGKGGVGWFEPGARLG